MIYNYSTGNVIHTVNISNSQDVFINADENFHECHLHGHEKKTSVEETYPTNTDLAILYKNCITISFTVFIIMFKRNAAM